MRAFLELTGYYWRLIKGFGIILKPLTEMVKKGNFNWSKECRKALERLKVAMVNAPVPALLDLKREFVVETNDRDYGVGVVLMQM